MRYARAMNAREPHKTEPTGAHSPLLRQKVTEIGLAHQLTGRQAQGSRRIEDARPIDVKAQAKLAR